MGLADQGSSGESPQLTQNSEVTARRDEMYYCILIFLNLGYDGL